MRRIGNFLFVEQLFSNARPRPAIIAMDNILLIMEKLIDYEFHTAIILKNDSAVLLTGDHDDNIIELSKLLNN